jgi:hypothetical protein
MTDIIPTIETKENSTTKLVSWLTLTSTNTAGIPVELSAWGDRSVHIFGTVGGATLVIQGSNDGVNWVTLNDVANGSLSFTAIDVLYQIQEVPRYIRPSTSGGGGTQDIDVVMLMRRSNQSRQ